MFYISSPVLIPVTLALLIARLLAPVMSLSERLKILYGNPSIPISVPML
jgi:predicted PurR-regulated permease PerM